MERLALLLAFIGAFLLWVDTWLLSKVISPTRISLGDQTGCRTALSWLCSRIGITLITIGFLLQLLRYEPEHSNEQEPTEYRKEQAQPDIPDGL
jgi:hypothetical protein